MMWHDGATVRTIPVLSQEDLRAGDWVEVRSKEEILRTLDERGELESMPFMPEMFAFCGKRFRVYKRAHKTCDTVNDYKGRKLKDAVHLEGTRCDGQSHGGCQAGCLLFWKTAWLKPVDGHASEPDESASQAMHKEPDCTRATLDLATRINGTVPEDVRYRCQATEILRATTPLSPLEPWQYIRDLSSRNITPMQLFRYMTLAILRTMMVTLRNLKAKWRGRAWPAGNHVTPTAFRVTLNLQPGDTVQIRSHKEIMATLNSERKNLGLSFDSDMAQFCGSKHKVLHRVERIIDEKTGKMITISRDCIVLEDVICRGLDCRQRLFCPRGVFTYWREAWLKPERATPEVKRPNEGDFDEERKSA